MTDTNQSTGTAPRSRLPSPGCLFAVTLLVALASLCFWMGWQVHRKRVQLEYFEQLGVQARTEPAKPVWLHDLVVARFGEEFASGFTDITVIENLDNAQVTDADLQHLSGLTNLEALDLNGTQVTDAGLQYLSDLTNLQWLMLARTQVTDAGLQHLSGLTSLEIVFLNHTQVTDAGVAELQSHLPGVQIIRW